MWILLQEWLEIEGCVGFSDALRCGVFRRDRRAGRLWTMGRVVCFPIVAIVDEKGGDVGEGFKRDSVV